MNFEQLKLTEPLLRAVNGEGYTMPTPIQVQAIPHILEERDILGCAQTGTGKTAAFALPTLQRLAAIPARSKHRPIRALILSPTRELALQLGESFKTYGRYVGLKHAVIFGGVGQNPQVEALRRGIDILVATPGRLLDLMGQGFVNLRHVEIFTLDEADQMLDMGFIPSVRKIIEALPAQRQNLLFSATMPPDIRALADQILDNPVSVYVNPPATTVELIQQSLYYVDKNNKPDLLKHLLQDRDLKRVLIFTRTKHGADKVLRKIQSIVAGDVIHGNKSQSARERALNAFKENKIWVLVATDIAARGIDIDDISHVINYDLPNIPESYVHRIGRTARAGAGGTAISFCDAEEFAYVKGIESLIRMQIPVVEEHPYVAEMPVLASPKRQDFKRSENKRPFFAKRRDDRSPASSGSNGANKERRWQNKKRPQKAH